MSRFLTAFIVLVVAGTTGAAQTLREYFDGGTGTLALVPADWQPSGDDPKWEGTRFFSRDREAWLAVWGKRDIEHTPRVYQKMVAEAAGDRVTYSRRGQNWFVVSGFKGDRIFYVKAIRRCGRETWHQVAFEYPAERKRAYDSLVTAVSQSLRAQCDYAFR